MAATDVAVNIVMKAVDNTKAAVDSATANIGRMEKASGAARVAMGALAGLASSSLVGALSDVANAAAEDAANITKLKVAVENSGASWEENTAIINTRIKAGQNMAFTDTQTRDSLAALTQTTGSLDRALQLQTLAMDLARAKGMDLTKASELVGRVAMGNTTILQRYGVVLGENATAQDALAALQQKFGGQAEAYGNTTQAAIFKVKDSIDEWRESIGSALGPAMQYIALLPGMTSGVQLAGLAFGALTPAIQGSITATLAAAAPIIAVVAALALVAVAIWKVVEVVQLVTENWNVFTYALTRGDLNDIPLFGFIFGKAQQVMGVIQGLIGLWNTLTSIMGQAQSASPADHAAGGNWSGGASVGVYHSGTPSVPRTGLAWLEKGERVIPADQNRAGNWGGTTVNIYADVIDSQAVDRLADRIGGRFVQQRRLQGLA